jgi:hypothetical protein
VDRTVVSVITGLLNFRFFLVKVRSGPGLFPVPLTRPANTIPTTDKNGDPCFKSAFNTQACEQLNSRLGGYESILKCMIPGNFDWFLHAMLYYHTKHVLRKQNMKRKMEENEIQDNISESASQDEGLEEADDINSID